MHMRAFVTVFFALTAGAARADFSIICDEQAQIEDILQTTRAKGFYEARQKFRAYVTLRDDRNEATCEMSRVPHPAKLGKVVAHYDNVEFVPDQSHDVLVVELHVGERILFATLNAS